MPRRRLKATRAVSPKKSPKKASPKASPKKASPKKSPKKASPKPSPKGDTKKKSRKARTYGTYIHRVLEQVHPNLRIAQTSLDQLDQAIKVIIARFRDECIKLLELSHKVTINARTIQTATRVIFPGELAKHAVSEGSKAVGKYNASGAKPGAKAPQFKAAGLVFPVMFTRKLLTMEEMGSKIFQRVGAAGPVYLAAVLEYLTAEILELAGNAARDNDKRTIKPYHFLLAMSNDFELETMFDNLGIVLTGIPVRPGVDKALLFTKAEKDKRAAERGKKRIGKARKNNKGGYYKVPGAKALQDIKKVQKMTNTILPKASFGRLIREIAQAYKTDLRFNVEAMNILQRGVEDYMLKLYRIANKLAIHADRRTVQPKDLILARDVSDPARSGALVPDLGYKKTETQL